MPLMPGLGGRVSWRPNSFLGLEAELNVFPRDFPSGRPFSRGRFEGLFGATAGATFDRFRPFVRVRPGFVAVQESPEPFACILIFPPPLTCTLASGRTLAAVDLGGGVDIATTARTFVRVDLGDRLVRYPGPVVRLRSDDSRGSVLRPRIPFRCRRRRTLLSGTRIDP